MVGLRGCAAAALACCAVLLGLQTPSASGSSPTPDQPLGDTQAAAVATGPNVFVYNLDDLRDLVPRGVDPLRYMPKLRRWMRDGTRYANSFVATPSCCPSRAAMMTGRYAHNNGVRLQTEAPRFDYPHSMACYLQRAGYRTHIAGKFLISWPRTTLPPCFSRSTVMWGGYHDVGVKVDGVAGTATGYSTTYLGRRGRDYIRAALEAGVPFLLYETPQAPHWVNVTQPDGTVVRRAVPEATYADAPVEACVGPTEADRSDKPAYVRSTNKTVTESQAMCASQLRAIMSADDEFGATMRLLANRGVLDDTLVVFTSDNGYMWGEHGRTEKFVPYEPSIRVPLLVRWPGHVPAGANTTRLVSEVDILPTVLQATGVTPPADAPPLDGESLLGPSRRRAVFSEYFRDSANGNVPTWRMVRTPDVKLVQTYDDTGAVTFSEYYDLRTDPIENLNLLHDGDPANNPPAGELSALRSRLANLSTCRGSACVD